MSVPEFPIHLAELKVNILKSFVFTLPIEETGRDDIQIFVDYAVSEDGNNAIYEAWAQFTDANIRAMVYDGVVPCKGDESAITDIICELNMSEKFHDTVQSFIEHFDR